VGHVLLFTVLLAIVAVVQAYAKSVFLRPFIPSLPFCCQHTVVPPCLLKQTQGGIFKQFYLKKSIHTIVSSSVWWSAWQPSQSF